MKSQKSNKQIANRHIGKLLHRIEEVIELPDMVKSDIRRQMHFLAEDIAVSERKELVKNEDRLAGVD